MTTGVWLRLGRVSNLPTVWSNVLAALALSGALPPEPLAFGALLLAFSLFYVGGMYLNDAFDRELDRRERPGRPIPSGQVSAASVFVLGFAGLVAGTALAGSVASRLGASLPAALGSGAALAALIVLYDAFHKRNPLSPLLMGGCRVMIYVAVAHAVSDGLTPALWLGAASLLCHLIGLTYAAKQEAHNRLSRVWPLAFLAWPVVYGAGLAVRQPLAWPAVVAFAAWLWWSLRWLSPGPRRAVPQAIVRLIAGISLLDAVLIAGAGSPGWALAAAAMCALTRLFQRVIPGT